MKQTVDIKPVTNYYYELGKGDYCQDGAGYVYIITAVHEQTYSALLISNGSKDIVCVPKNSLTPFYGTITILCTK